MKPSLNIDGLPGAELVEQGLIDARAGKETVFTCLLAMAAPRLQRAGIISTTFPVPNGEEAEITLYRLLQREPGDAYSRYGSYVRRLVSFQHALDLRLGANGAESRK